MWCTACVYSLTNKETELHLPNIYWGAQLPLSMQSRQTCSLDDWAPHAPIKSVTQVEWLMICIIITVLGSCMETILLSVKAINIINIWLSWLQNTVI